jgi:hypothetical protein
MPIDDVIQRLAHSLKEGTSPLPSRVLEGQVMSIGPAGIGFRHELLELFCGQAADPAKVDLSKTIEKDRREPEPPGNGLSSLSRTQQRAGIQVFSGGMLGSKPLSQSLCLLETKRCKRRAAPALPSSSQVVGCLSMTNQE